MAARISGLAVAQAIAGFLLVWSGLRNASIKDTLTGFAKGTVPQGTPTGPPTLSVGSTGGTSSSSSSTGSKNAPAAPANVSGNVAKGKLMAAAYGWGSGPEWNALYALWQQESGWSNTAQNPNGGAYGIPQALPYTKMPKAAWPPSAGGSASAATQIAWGLAYIKSRWGSPSVAWGGYAARGSWY